MPRVVLTRDVRTKLYTAPAMAIRAEVPDCADPTGDPFINFEMIVDSGSNQTSISEAVAGRCGISLAHRKRESTAGIGGYTSTPVVTNLPLYLMADSGPVSVRLPQLTVIKDREEVETFNDGVHRKRRVRRLPGVSLLGLDSMAYLGATLKLMPSKEHGELYW